MKKERKIDTCVYINKRKAEDKIDLNKESLILSTGIDKS